MARDGHDRGTKRPRLVARPFAGQSSSPPPPVAPRSVEPPPRPFVARIGPASTPKAWEPLLLDHAAASEIEGQEHDEKAPAPAPLVLDPVETPIEMVPPPPAVEAASLLTEVEPEVPEESSDDSSSPLADITPVSVPAVAPAASSTVTPYSPYPASDEPALELSAEQVTPVGSSAITPVDATVITPVVSPAVPAVDPNAHFEFDSPPDAGLELVRATLDAELSRFDVHDDERPLTPPPFPRLTIETPRSVARLAIDVESTSDPSDSPPRESDPKFDSAWPVDEQDAAQALEEALTHATSLDAGDDAAEVLEGIARRIRSGEIVVARTGRSGRGGHRHDAATLAAVLASLLGDRA